MGSRNNNFSCEYDKFQINYRTVKPRISRDNSIPRRPNYFNDSSFNTKFKKLFKGIKNIFIYYVGGAMTFQSQG